MSDGGEVESCSPMPAVECPPESKYYSAIYAAMISADLQLSKQSHSHRIDIDMICHLYERYQDD